MSAKKGKKTVSRKSAAGKPAGAGRRKKTLGKPGAIDHAELLARAWAMEVEASERYATFADAMDEHNNREVAELFRKLSRIEQRHADQILEENFSMHPPVVPLGGMRWVGAEGPETADPGDLHYRMQPYHALQIAFGCEKHACEFFTELARNATSAKVRKAALEMAEEEAEHMRLIEDWLKRTPPPAPDWEHDPDPPVLSD